MRRKIGVLLFLVGGVAGVFGKELVFTQKAGDAFGKVPATRVDSSGKARGQGSVFTEDFTVEAPFLNFEIEAGRHPFRAAASLWVDGKVARTTTGRGAGGVAVVTWDLRELRGKRAHVGVHDYCVEEAVEWVKAGRFEFSEKAAAEPSGADVEGSVAEVRREAVEAIRRNAPVAAKDPWRPVFHYAPPSQRMNDPNGPGWADGWHHVFYQHMVFVGSGPATNVHWGHARSRDLVNWETLPLGVFPEYEVGELSVFSGNLGEDFLGRPVQFTTMVPYKRDAWRRIWLARPLDAEWVKWERVKGNPPEGLAPRRSAEGHIKDPFPFSVGKRRFVVFTDDKDTGIPIWEAVSEDLMKWEFRGLLDEKSAECPNFFEVEPRGEGAGVWMYLSSPHAPVRYVTGTFDVKAGKFVEKAEGRLNHGGGFYASTLYRDGKGRTILLGVTRGQKGGRGWTGALALPRVLKVGEDGRPRMFPVEEMESLRGRELFELKREVELRDEKWRVESVRGDVLEIVAKFRAEGAKRFGLKVRCSEDGESFLPVMWEDGELVVGKRDAKWPCEYELERKGGELELRVFLDKGILDACTGDGRRFESRIHEAPVEDLGVEVFAEGGGARLLELRAWEMLPAQVDHSRLLGWKKSNTTYHQKIVFKKSERREFCGRGFGHGLHGYTRIKPELVCFEPHANGRE